MTDTLTGEVLGFRCWLTLNELLWSTSFNRHGPWTPGTNTAACYANYQKVEHDAPHHTCRCGLYAMHQPVINKTVRLPTMYGPNLHRAVLIMGAIAAWGRVEVHRDGFRAEKTRVLGLARSSDLDLPSPGNLDEVACHYSVPVVDTIETLQRLVADYAPVPPALRPIPTETSA